MLPGSICSGNHSVTTFSSATIVTSAISELLYLDAARPPDERTVSRTSAPAGPSRSLFLGRTPVENLRPHFAHRITQAYAQQRLARILEDVDHLALRVLQVHALAVCEQVVLRAVA